MVESVQPYNTYIMMWIIGLYAAPMYGMWRGAIATPKVKVSYTPFTLDWLGIVTGNYWDYTITGELWGSGTERDSVFLVGTTPDTLGTCVFVGGLPGANYQVDRTTDSTSGTGVDTGFIYFRQGYDNLYGDGGAMVMKYMPSLGNSWEAWDTCFISLNTKLPIGDIDGDTVVDSLWVRSSNTRVSGVSADTFTTVISPLKYVVWISSLYTRYGVDSIVIWDYYRYKFVANFGKIEEHLDSERIRYYIGAFLVLDTTFRNLYHKFINTTSTKEYTQPVITNSTYVYTASGRFAGKAIPNRKGVYFVVMSTDKGKLIRKVVVK